MNTPAPPIFRPDEFPDEDPRLLSLVSTGFRDANNALARVKELSVVSGSFMSAASGVTEVSVKNPLGRKPQHVTVDLRRDDLADFTAAWSWWYVLSGEQIRLKFVSLPASARHVYSVGLL